MTKENEKRERTKESKEKEDTSSAHAARAREELFSDKLYAAALSAIETAGKEHKPPHPRQVISMAATGKGLIVSGEYGVGKTALASLAARAFGFVTLIECILETGRTHQIRAHMKHIGHPLFSDERYGGCEILRGTRSSTYKAFINNCFKICPRQALHARTLGFVQYL